MAASATAGRAPGPYALLVLAALLLLLTPPHAAAAPSCSSVYGTLMPCLGYVQSGGAVPSACCAAIKQVVSGAHTTPDRRAICACLKDLAAAAPAPYIGRAEGLPDRCGVQLGYKLSPNMDCNSIN